MRDYNSKKPPAKKVAAKRPQSKELQPKRKSSARNTMPKKNVAKSQRQVKRADNLKVIPIGGLNEIGKNLTVLEYKEQILVIDCGMSFPEDEMYGIDVVIPDFSYLVKNASKIVGVVITQTQGARPARKSEYHQGRR